MLASLAVFIAMIALILLSVVLFGEEVAGGPLQISMTLATLIALGVAYYYGFRGALINEAVMKGVNAALGTIFIILAIGAIIGALYLSGTVAAFVYYGVTLVSPRLFYLIVFVLASLLSVLTGSSFTTIGAVGVAFVGLASLVGVSPAVAAGAAVAGAFLGDKLAKISDTFVLATSVVGGVTLDEHGRMMRRTAIPAWIISAVIYLVMGLFSGSNGAPIDPALVQRTIGSVFNISPLAFLPVVLVFVLSSLRLSGFITLMASAIFAVVLAGFTQPALITSIANDPSLGYLGAVFKVGVDTFATGFKLNSEVPELNRLFSGGGTLAMFETIWLILVAASFGAITEHSGMIQRVIAPVIQWAKTSTRLVFATMFSTSALNVLTADPYVSIVLVSRMYREGFMQQKLKPVALSTLIADSGSIISPIIPWNVHGAFIAGALGIGVLEYAPFAFFCYLTPLVTLVMAFLYFRKEKLSPATDAEQTYGDPPPTVVEPKLSA
jgi:NhaC family Na+:H+ antiporter